MLAAADILIICLKIRIQGTVPSKLYEAMAAGKPVVAVAEGEAVQVLERYQCGLAVRPGDIDGIVRAFRELASDPAKRARFGEAGRKAAELYFDRRNLNKALIRHLEEVL